MGVTTIESILQALLKRKWQAGLIGFRSKRKGGVLSQPTRPPLSYSIAFPVPLADLVCSLHR